MRLFKLALTIALAMFIIDAATANATVNTFSENTPSDGVYKWSTAANWSDGVPDATDRAVIPDNLTCTIYAGDSNAVADTISVAGTLNIQTYMKLSLDNSDDNIAADPDDSEVTGDGFINLQASGSELAFISNDHAVSESGAIVGQSASAFISIASGIKLTSSTTIQGALEIKDATTSGSFENQGKVYANSASGTLKISVDSVTDTDNGGTVSDTNFRWGVNASQAKLLFVENDVTGLLGDFFVRQGSLEVGEDPEEGGDDIDVCSTGDTYFDGGNIVTGLADSFKCSGSCP